MKSKLKDETKLFIDPIRNCKSTKSISLPNRVGKYGATLFRPKEIVTKPDTSTSIVVEWKNTKKLSPQVPVKEDLNIIHKNSLITDGKIKVKN